MVFPPLCSGKSASSSPWGGGPGGVGAFLLDSLQDCVRKDGEAVGDMLLEEVQRKEMGQQLSPGIRSGHEAFGS